MIKLVNISKTYKETVLSNITLTFKRRGLYLIKGPSGCGKTTLLHILGGLDKEYVGKMYIYKKLVDKKKRHPQHVSYIFQQFHLLNFLNIRNNIALPRFFNKTKKKTGYLEKVDINNKRIIHLSGGQRQLVAIKRALNKQVDVLLCDEPTGSLDKESRKIVYKQLQELSKHILVIIVSHDDDLNEIDFDEIIEMDEGKVINITKNKIEQLSSNTSIVNQTKKSTISYALYQCISKWKRNSKVFLAISFSIFFILLTFTLTNALKRQIIVELKVLFPDMAIVVEKENNVSFNSEEVNKIQQYSQYTYLESDEYYQIGISNTKEYNIDETYYISDMTKSISESQIAEGSLYTKNDEIILSPILVNKLFYKQSFQDVINEKVYIHYQGVNGIEAVEKKVVGISKQDSLFDTIYVKENMNIHDIETAFNIVIEEYSFVLMEADDASIEKLADLMPEFTYRQTGKDTRELVEDITSQVNVGLLFFSGLIVISSCFLLGQILFLSSLERKKEISICKCFGASNRQISLLIYLEALLLYHLGFVIAISSYYSSVVFINHLVYEKFDIQTFLQMDIKSIISVYIVALFFCFISTIIPANKAMNGSTIEGLQAKG